MPAAPHRGHQPGNQSSATQADDERECSRPSGALARFRAREIPLLLGSGLAQVDPARKPELPLGALRAVAREDRLVVLTGHVKPQHAPAARLIVSQHEALLAMQPHRSKIRRRIGRSY
jgi:hypothetical protein